MSPPALRAAEKKASTAWRDGALKAIWAAPGVTLNNIRLNKSVLYGPDLPWRILTDEEISFTVDTEPNMVIMLPDISITERLESS